MKVFSEYGMITTIHSSLPSNASDDFTFKSSLHKTGCLSRAHKTSSCLATTANSISTREILDTKNLELGEDNHSSVHNLLQVKAQATHKLTGEYHQLEYNPLGHSSQQAWTTLDQFH